MQQDGSAEAHGRSSMESLESRTPFQLLKAWFEQWPGSQADDAVLTVGRIVSLSQSQIKCRRFGPSIPASTACPSRLQYMAELLQDADECDMDSLVELVGL